MNAEKGWIISKMRQSVFVCILNNRTFWESLRPLLDPYLTLTIARVWRGVQILIIVLFFLRCFVEEDGAIFICSQKGVLFAYMKKK